MGHSTWTYLHMLCTSGVYLLVAAVSSAGYKFLASRMKQQEEPDAAQTAEDAFLVQLDEVENQLARHSGPYLVG